MLQWIKARRVGQSYATCESIAEFLSWNDEPVIMMAIKDDPIMVKRYKEILLSLGVKANFEAMFVQGRLELKYVMDKKGIEPLYAIPYVTEPKFTGYKITKQEENEKSTNT